MPDLILENKMKNANIQTMMETVERIFNASHTVLSAMSEGSRTQIKDLAEKVGLAVSMEPKHVLGFVNHFVHHTDVAYVTRGKHGGIIRGARPVKVEKPKKAKKVSAAPSDSTSSN